MGQTAPPGQPREVLRLVGRDDDAVAVAVLVGPLVHAHRALRGDREPREVVARRRVQGRLECRVLQARDHPGVEPAEDRAEVALAHAGEERPATAQRTLREGRRFEHRDVELPRQPLAGAVPERHVHHARRAVAVARAEAAGRHRGALDEVERQHALGAAGRALRGELVEVGHLEAVDHEQVLDRRAPAHHEVVALLGRGQDARQHAHGAYHVFLHARRAAQLLGREAGGRDRGRGRAARREVAGPHGHAGERGRRGLQHHGHLRGLAGAHHDVADQPRHEAEPAHVEPHDPGRDAAEHEPPGGVGLRAERRAARRRRAGRVRPRVREPVGQHPHGRAGDGRPVLSDHASGDGPRRGLRRRWRRRCAADAADHHAAATAAATGRAGRRERRRKGTGGGRMLAPRPAVAGAPARVQSPPRAADRSPLSTRSVRAGALVGGAGRRRPPPRRSTRRSGRARGGARGCRLRVGRPPGRADAPP